MEQMALQQYADLLVRTAVALQPGQPLYIESDLDSEEFVCLVQQAAFSAGASDVTVRWVSNRFERGRLTEPGCGFETAQADCARVEELIRQKAAYLRLESPDPEQWSEVPPARLQERLRAEYLMRTAFRRSSDLQNVIACAATLRWARAVFPELEEDQALDRLWSAILGCTMADQPDPVEAWHAEIAQTNLRKAYMNAKQYKALRLKSATVDLVLGLPEEQVWEGGGRTTPEGVFFMPNLPSYEVFTSPVARSAEGWVKATMPLNYQGQLIEEICLTFHDGRVVDYSAGRGEELLGEILSYDSCASRLGEVALVEQGTAVAKQNCIFYTTVCDENASCHLALGNGFAFRGEEDAAYRGINRSKIHVDFMFGSDDLCVSGQTADGRWEEFFHNGTWVIGNEAKAPGKRIC